MRIWCFPKVLTVADKRNPKSVSVRILRENRVAPLVGALHDGATRSSFPMDSDVMYCGLSVFVTTKCMCSRGEEAAYPMR